MKNFVISYYVFLGFPFLDSQVFSKSVSELKHVQYTLNYNYKGRQSNLHNFINGNNYMYDKGFQESFKNNLFKNYYQAFVGRKQEF